MMRSFATHVVALFVVATTLSAQQNHLHADATTPPATDRTYVGFDNNEYPGDEALPVLRRHFAFAGYWLNNPPGEDHNSWQGKREVLLRNGFGFMVLANGRLEAAIKKSKRTGVTPAALGARDAADAIAAAKREHFPANTILFLDQEEGGRLTADQSAYLLAWTEGVARSGYLPGAYASGQPVNDAPGKTITTIQDIREQVAAQHLHEIAMWVYQDACPPANGCTMQPPPLSASGTSGVTAWQYAQSPRRREITAACSKTYASDGNCYAPELPRFTLDLSVSSSADPSHGR
ncbi:glycoside hydrolase domain-containing protein [Tunturiibacter lichenicola]|uniref:glycoside hydrolase domain-containing protein n=1 Tax=Tunturiibacter lichenicola TaxID=2051959 RepID=UPI0021B41472|nr:glycoside hydrolase domain-containing protein [Edaphobacter lichenicola]